MTSCAMSLYMYHLLDSFGSLRLVTREPVRGTAHIHDPPISTHRNGLTRNKHCLLWLMWAWRRVIELSRLAVERVCSYASTCRNETRHDWEGAEEGRWWGQENAHSQKANYVLVNTYTHTPGDSGLTSSRLLLTLLPCLTTCT